MDPFDLTEDGAILDDILICGKEDLERPILSSA
jgi:hypothetical protein